MKTQLGLNLAFGGLLAAASHITSSVSSASDSSPRETLVNSTVLEFVETITHILPVNPTGLPDSPAPKFNFTNAHRKYVDEQFWGGEMQVFEKRGGHKEGDPNPMHVPREWIQCRGKGYDPWLNHDKVLNCMWDKANGEGNGIWPCDGREFYMDTNSWKNRTEGVIGCEICWTWCTGTMRAWCDCSSQTDLHFSKFWVGWMPIRHVYTTDWQSWLLNMSTSFLGQKVGTSFREPRAEPTSVANLTETLDAPATLEDTADMLVQTTETEPSSRLSPSSAPAAIEPPTSTTSSSTRSHITPPPPRKYKRGGSPEWHMYTPDKGNTAEARYSSLLVRNGVMDEEGRLNQSLIRKESPRPDHRWHNATGIGNNGTNSSMSMNLTAREPPTWHWIKQPSHGKTCVSQGYSPQVNGSIYDLLKNSAHNRRLGQLEFNVPYDLNLSINTQLWHDADECFEVCKDCVSWAIKDQRNLLWCDFRVAWWSNCHVGWDPIQALWRAKTDVWGDYITSSIPTLTDSWYTTPTSLIMASQQHITPWLPIKPSVTSTHFYVNASQATIATGPTPYWDVYCTASYAGFELSDYITTRTRTNYDWSGWYTNVPEPTTANPTTGTDGRLTPVTSTSAPQVYSTIYPTACAAAAASAPVHPAARAVRIDMLQRRSIQDGEETQDTPGDCLDCQTSCTPCIEWAFHERRANVSCMVKAPHDNHVGLCEADFALSLQPTGTQTLALASPVPQFTPSWPASWTGPKIVNASVKFTPVIRTVSDAAETYLTTEWWHGQSMLPAATAA